MADIITNKRLVIVSDGALQYLPFGALPTPVSLNTGNIYKPLARQHEIISLPSATTIAVIREETRPKTSLVNSTIVFADPVFDANDERLKNVPHSKQESNEVTPVQSSFALQRAAEKSLSGSDNRLPRLRGTREEANQIIALVRPGQGKQLLDFDANRNRATGDEIEGFRYVHFATHGWLDAVHPELSGVVLSLFDEQGKPQPGFLQLHDIYNLRLNADLVVLSACKTGLAKDIKGEGLIGLTRGFMYAGSPRVVVSLWSVSDVATAELMKRFYRELLVNGQKPAQALRSAQASMSCAKDFNSPYYWAAFTFQGEWR